MWYDDPLSFIIVILNIIFIYVAMTKKVIIPIIVGLLMDLFAYGLAIIDGNFLAIAVTGNLAPLLMWWLED